MESGTLHFLHHSFVFRQEDSVYKVHYRKPSNQAIFPNVGLENLAEYEKRVHFVLEKSSDIVVPKCFDLVSPQEMRDMFCLNVRQDDLSQKVIDYLDTTALSCVRSTYLPSDSEVSFEDLTHPIEHLRGLGFEMRDFGMTLFPTNVLLSDSKIAFYDFKSFFPISDEMKEVFSDLIEPDPSYAKFLRQ